MQSAGARKILFVVNPKSGPGKQSWETLIKEYLENMGINFEFVILNKDLTPEVLAEKIKKFDPERIVAVGGDGTIRFLAEQLAGLNIPLGIIPGGSANGLAKELLIPVEYEKALDLALNGTPKPIDLIRINNEICIHLSDIGINALIIRQFEHGQKRGMLGYLKALVKAMWRKTLIKVSIQLDDKTIQRKAYMIVIANATKYGTGATINPIGKIDDGLFEIVIVQRLALVELFKMLVTHKPFDPANIEVFSTSKVKLVARHRYYFQVDGEYRGRVREAEAWIQPGHLKVIVGETESR